MARLFFALWPSEAARRELATLARDLAVRSGGRPVPEAKIHLTLAFLGDTPADRLGAALEAARSVPGERFLARLDCVGSFARSGVAWAGMSKLPPQLTALARDLSSALASAGFALEDRAFAAHATLARRIRRRVAAEAIAPIEWQAVRFALVESDLRTGKYETRESWELEAR